VTITRDEILLDNIKEALALYQRSLVWATTAALSGLLIAIRLRGPTPEPVQILSSSLSAPVAWIIAQGLYVVFGGLAVSAIRRYELALAALNPSEEIYQAIRLYPSLATLPGRAFRLGSVWLPLAATVASWTIELLREGSTSTYSRDVYWWLGMLLVALILLTPYLSILGSLRKLRQWGSLASRSIEAPGPERESSRRPNHVNEAADSR
jgi:hypothetical protein